MPSSLVYDPWYATCVIDGTKNSARNVPVSSKITNDQSAISPSMNDQWSGNTLRMNRFRDWAACSLSSSQPPRALSDLGISPLLIRTPGLLRLPDAALSSLY